MQLILSILLLLIMEGDIYTGKVVSIKDFGAFLEFAPGKRRHSSYFKLFDKRVNHVEDVADLG